MESGAFAAAPEFKVPNCFGFLCVDFGQASVYRIKPTYVSSESVSILLQGDQLFHGRSQQAEQPLR